VIASANGSALVLICILCTADRVVLSCRRFDRGLVAIDLNGWSSEWFGGEMSVAFRRRYERNGRAPADPGL